MNLNIKWPDMALATKKFAGLISILSRLTDTKPMK